MKAIKFPAKVRDKSGYSSWKLTKVGDHIMYQNDKTMMMAPPSRVGVAALLEEQNVMGGELSGFGELAKVKTDEIIDAFKDFVDRIGKNVKKDRGFVEHDPIPIQNVLLVAGGAWLLWEVFKRGAKE